VEQYNSQGAGRQTAQVNALRVVCSLCLSTDALWYLSMALGWEGDGEGLSGQHARHSHPLQLQLMPMVLHSLVKRLSHAAPPPPPGGMT
jgi:hypothetical protein